jgi:DNA topoisomerase VI subunit B
MTANMDDDGGAEAVAAKPKAGKGAKAPPPPAETGPKAKRRQAETKAEEMATKQREISVAEFFAKNRHLLGFDNPRKALLTTVKEAVDNSLDACEEAGIRPDIYVEIQPVKDEEDRFRVIVEDNGPGIVKEQIGKIFAKLLYGSKFHSLRQSLTADQRVLIERSGRVEWVPIGTLVDDLVPQGDELADVSRERIRVPAFDRKTGKYAWRPVSHAIRHPRANEILEVRTELGKSVRVTGCHSLFTYDPERRRVREVEARALRPGDYVVAPKCFPAPGRVSQINLLESLSIDQLKTRWIYVYGVRVELLAALRARATEHHHRGSDGRSRRYFRLKDTDGRDLDILDDSWCQYETKRFLPASIVRRLGIERECASARLRTYFHGRRLETPVIWKLTPALMRFLGLYVAEGHSDRRQVGFTFAAKERSFVEEIVRTARSLGLSTTTETRPRNAVRVRVFGGALDLLLPAWCGDGAHAKRVPAFVFSASRDLRQHFLDALYQGDGHLVRNRDVLMLTTVSRTLLEGIEALWFMQGVAAARHGPFEPLGLGRSPSLTWRLDVHGADIGASHVFESRAQRRQTNRYRMFPVSCLALGSGAEASRVAIDAGELIRAAGLGKYEPSVSKSVKLVMSTAPRRHYATSELTTLVGSRMTRHVPEQFVRLGYFQRVGKRYVPTRKLGALRREVASVFDFAASDLCLLRVREVREIQDPSPFVYDLSVPGCENFVAGNGGIACHNSRGQQGIGISAAGMYGQLTTGKPMFITSRIGKKHPAHRIELRIDTTKNQPEILKEQDIPDWESEHGTRVEIELVAKYLKGRQSVDEYLALTAVANPHIEIAYKPPEGDVQVFKRATKEMPVLPAEIKPHPHGVELGVLMKILKSSEQRRLKAALKDAFSRVSDKVAEEICDAAKLSPDARPGTIANREADALYKAIQGVKMMAPPTDCLAPIGQDLILEGMKKEVDADFFVTITRPPKVYRGNPFCIEVGLALGGNLPADEPARVMRFANRVPLQYQSGACAITKAAISVDWKNYHLQQSRGALPVGPIVIFVHIASVWVPFTSESKEAIAGYDEIINEMRLGLMDCGRKLGIFLNRRKREAEEAKKRSYIDTYIPQIGVALQDILDLTNEARDKAVTKLKDVLERSRTP